MEKQSHDVAPMCVEEAPQTYAADAALPAYMTGPGGIPAQAQSAELRACDPGGGAVLASDHADVDGRPPAAVGAALRARLRRHAEVTGDRIADAIAMMDLERGWAAAHGPLDALVDLVNPVYRPDPQRWAAVLAGWQAADRALGAALAYDGALAGLGAEAAGALRAVQAAERRARAARGELARYLDGHADAALEVAAAAEITRDVAFAVAVSGATLAMAPHIMLGARLAAPFLEVGQGAATALGGAAIAGAGAGVGAVIGGAGQGVAALIGEALAAASAVSEAAVTGQRTLDGIDWQRVADQGFEGLRRGVVDGALAPVGVALERAAAAGAVRLMGEAGPGVFAPLLRHGVERAAAGGASGAVVGALDGGLKAALAGEGVEGISAAMEGGFLAGGVTGGVLGGAAGAVDGAGPTVDRARAAHMRGLLARDPEAFGRAHAALVGSMSPAQRAAFDAEVFGRRFVDRQDYAPAAEAYAAGRSATAPAHRYGREAFEGWREAARLMDRDGARGNPLDQGALEAAHGLAMTPVAREQAARHAQGGPAPGITADHIGRARGPDIQRGLLIGAGGLGPKKTLSALTPEEFAVLQRNPHIDLLLSTRPEEVLTEAQMRAGMRAAIIVYPDAGTVQRRLDGFFAWYTAHRATADPVALAAEAQQRLVSIHPFMDGNGRVTRLAMDHILRERGLPPALLHDTRVDLVTRPEAWVEGVREGVMETWLTARRHVDGFNRALIAGDLRAAALHWGAVLAASSDEADVIGGLYETR